jgi:hypothetical protein
MEVTRATSKIAARSSYSGTNSSSNPRSSSRPRESSKPRLNCKSSLRRARSANLCRCGQDQDCCRQHCTGKNRTGCDDRILDCAGMLSGHFIFNLRCLFAIRQSRQLEADAEVVVLFGCGLQIEIRKGDLAVV